MQIEYTPVVQNQKDNPFYIFRPREKAILLKELEDRLLFICQLGTSKDKQDSQVYSYLTQERSKKEFGSAPHYGNQPNTALAALAGSIDKLRRGDLSQKQINNITFTLEVLSKAYPNQFSNITFVERNSIEVEIPLEKFFEIQYGE